MIKRSIWKLLGYYISGNSMPDKNQVDSWIENNPEQHQIMNDLNQFKKMVDKGNSTEAGQHTWKILQKRIHDNYRPDISPKELHISHKTFSISTTAKIAAALAFFIIVGGALLYMYRNHKFQSSTIEVVCDLNAKKRLVLPDGTVVWLNANSKIKYPASFNGLDKRVVYLMGEGYFDVKHNSKQPFVVNTSNFNIEVLGTSFNVKSYPDEDNQVATLVRGSIKLKTSGVLDDEEKEILLTPNQQVTFSKSKKQIKLDMVEAETVASWMLCKYKFKHESFLEISKKLATAYNVKFHFTDTTLMNLYFTGTLKKSDSIDQIMSIIKAGFPIAYQIIGDSIVVRPKQ